MAAAPGSEREEDRRPGTAGVGRPAWVGDRPVPLTPIVGREREAAACGTCCSTGWRGW